MMEFENQTTLEAVAIYRATKGVFDGLFKEMRELSKKKPDATMSAGKVKMVNRVLADLKGLLENEPEGKFLDLLEDNDLPQVSDAVLVMVQYETTLSAFYKRYHVQVKWDYRDKTWEWIVPEIVEQYEEHQKDLARLRSEETAAFDDE